MGQKTMQALNLTYPEIHYAFPFFPSKFQFLDCPQPLMTDVDGENDGGEKDGLPSILKLLNSSQPTFLNPTGPIILSINVIGVSPQNGSNHSSTSPPSSAILAYSLLRTFRPILVQNAEQQQQPNKEQSKGGGWVGIVLFAIFMPLFILAILAGCAIFANQLLLRRKMVGMGE
jgi:hypothetical protein